MIVKEKLFSWSGDAFKIKYEDGSVLGNDLEFKAKMFSIRDELILLNGATQEPVCVAKSIFTAGFSRIFHIYSPKPVYNGQEPSKQKYNDQDQYTYAIVQRDCCSTEQAVHLIKDDNKFAYTIHRSSNWWPKSRTVQKDGVTCALMAGGTWEFNGNSYKITVCPGIDPCLMIMLCAICDEMDEDQKQN